MVYKMSIGEIIKQKRKEVGLTQKELADGICAQALISRVEKGDITPRKPILNQLEVRLGFDENELTQADQKKRHYSEVKFLKNTIQKYLAKNDYKIIELLLDQEKLLIESLNSINDKAFFTWIDAILQYNLYHETDYALELFNSIPLSELDNELMIKIVDTMGTIYYQNNDYQRAVNIYQYGINIVDTSINYKVQARIHLNYSLVLKDIKEYKDALANISTGIDLLIENNSLYLLGDFHYLKGQLFSIVGNVQEAQKDFEIAMIIFKLQNNNKSLALSQLAHTQTC